MNTRSCHAIKPGFPAASIHLCGEIAAQKWRISSRFYVFLSLVGNAMEWKEDESFIF